MMDSWTYKVSNSTKERWTWGPLASEEALPYVLA